MLRINYDLVKNIFSLSSLQILTLLIPIFLVPYYIKIIGLEKYGLIAYAAAVVNIINIAIDYGFNLSATARVSNNRNNEIEVRKILTSVFIIKVALFFICLVPIFLLAYFVETSADQKFIVYSSLGVCLGHIIIPTWLFHGLEKMKAFLLLNITYRSAMVVLILVFVRQSSDYLIIPVILSGTTLVGGVISLIYLHKVLKLRLLKVSFGEVWNIFSSSTIFFISKVATTSYTSLITIMLGALTTFDQVGVYSAAEKVLQAAKAVFTPITQAIFPFLVRLTSVDIHKSITFIKTLILFSLTFTTCVALSMFTLATQLSEFLFWDSGADQLLIIANTIKIFSVVPVIVGLSNILGVQLLIPRGYDKLFAIILSIAGFFGTVLCYYLIQNYGVYGAAVSGVVTELLIVIMMSYIVIAKKLLSNGDCDINEY